MKNNQKGFAGLVLIGVFVVLIGIGGYFFLAKKSISEKYYTYAECTEKTQLPCKHYFVGDLGQGWQPSSFRSKEECEKNGVTVGFACIIPPGNFKDVRWIDSADLERANPIKNEIIDNSKIESEIIASLKINWSTTQALIPFRPSHPGTVVWLSPDSVQFIGKNNLLVRFEDGYNPGMAVLSFDNDKFKISETFKNQGDFALSDWKNLIKKYGDSSYPVSTYTVSLLRNNEIVSFQDLTKVPENIFVKNYWEGVN